MNRSINFPLSEGRQKEMETEPTIEELRERGLNEIAIWDYCIENSIPISVDELDLTDRERIELIKHSSRVDPRQLFTDSEILAVWEENESFRASGANTEAMERCEKIKDLAFTMQKHGMSIEKLSWDMERDVRHGVIFIDIAKTCLLRGKEMDAFREMMNLADTVGFSYIEADDPERDPDFPLNTIRITFSVFNIWS